jgi:hypothetical protein
MAAFPCSSNLEFAYPVRLQRVLRTRTLRAYITVRPGIKMQSPHASAEFRTEARPRLQRKLIWLIVLVLSALVVAELSSRRIDQDTLRLVLRTTARTSALLFAVGFATPFWPRLKSYSDSLLLSFSFSQILHLIAIVWLVTIRNTQRALIDPPGLLAYSCVAVIVFRIRCEQVSQVSNGFRQLETIALYVFWLIITGAFAGLFPGIRFSGLHLSIVLFLCASLFMRVYSGMKMHRSWKPTETSAQP